MSKHKEKRGRPTVFTPQILDKLEQVFAIGGTDEEACFYAGVGKSALYNYQQDNPDFVERKEALKNKPILKARQTVVNALSETQHAQWYLQRKAKKEFSERTEHTGTDGSPLIPETVDVNINIAELAKEVGESLKKKKTEL